MILPLAILYPQCDGDANLDDIINIQDIVVIVSHVLGGDELEGEGFDNADINSDSTIDVVDIVIIINIIFSNDSQCDNLSALDLSLDWESQTDLSYFDYEELSNIIDNQISQLGYLHGIIVIHNGKIVSEEYYNSSANEAYNIWSVTKSYISTLVGQVIDQDFIHNQYLSLDNLLPDYGQAYLQSITLENLLSMTTGYYDGFGYPGWIYASTQQLEWMPYTAPGYFYYNNSACHMNSHVIYYATGMTPKEFAEINLFPYLGIENPQWLGGFNGINDGSASLELTLREMVKLGQLYIQDGFSGENNILSSDWIEQATSFQVPTYAGENLSGYGYLWWLPQEGFLAYGYGGQFIAVIPERNLVIGTHSNISSTISYQEQLLDYIVNDIGHLFEIEN